MKKKSIDIQHSCWNLERFLNLLPSKGVLGYIETYSKGKMIGRTEL